MKNISILPILLLLLATACSDQAEKVDQNSSFEQETIEQEVGDEKLTQELNQKLIKATRLIGLNQENEHEARNKNELEKLSEEDRQALIDLVIEESAKNIEEQTSIIIEQKESDTDYR